MRASVAGGRVCLWLWPGRSGGCEALKQRCAGVLFIYLYIGWHMQAGSSLVSHNHRASLLGWSGTIQTTGSVRRRERLQDGGGKEPLGYVIV